MHTWTHERYYMFVLNVGFLFFKIKVRQVNCGGGILKIRWNVKLNFCEL